MSRLPRAQEFLKTGFNAEAASAARLRAAAQRAASGGKPNLAKRLTELAAEKDALAIAQLEASGQLREAEEFVASALAEERYENDSLYPRMAAEVDEATARLFADTIARQSQHAERLERLLDELGRSKGDVG